MLKQVDREKNNFGSQDKKPKNIAHIILGIWVFLISPVALAVSRWLSKKVPNEIIWLEIITAIILALRYILNCCQDFCLDQKYDKRVKNTNKYASYAIAGCSAAIIILAFIADLKDYKGSKAATNLHEYIEDELQIARDLTLSIKDRLENAKNLALNSSDQLQVAWNLTNNISDQLQFAMSMTLNSSDQSQNASNINDQLQIAMNMTLSISDQLQITRNLTLNITYISDQLQVARNLTININDQLQAARNLTLNISDQSQIISNLTSNISDQLQFAINLTLNIIDQLQVARNMTLNISDQEISLAKALKTKITSQSKYELITNLNSKLENEPDLDKNLIDYNNYETKSNFTTVLDIFINGIFELNFLAELASYFASKERDYLIKQLVKYINENEKDKVIAKMFLTGWSLLHFGVILLLDRSIYQDEEAEEKKRVEKAEKVSKIMENNRKNGHPPLLILANLDYNVYLENLNQEYSLAPAQPPSLNHIIFDQQQNSFKQYILDPINRVGYRQDPQLLPLLILSNLEYNQSQQIPNQKYILVHISNTNQNQLPRYNPANLTYNQVQQNLNQRYYLVPINPQGQQPLVDYHQNPDLQPFMH